MHFSTIHITEQLTELQHGQNKKGSLRPPLLCQRHFLDMRGQLDPLSHGQGPTTLAFQARPDLDIDTG